MLSLEIFSVAFQEDFCVFAFYFGEMLSRGIACCRCCFSVSAVCFNAFAVSVVPT